MADYQLLEKKEEGEMTIISLKVSNDLFVSRKDKVFRRLTKDMTITGFRPGKAPKSMLEARLGADLYEKTLNELLPDITYEFLTQEKVEFLGRINYQVTKVSEAEGVEFKITFITYPEVKLPDFKKIKPVEEKIELTEEELDNELQNIFKYKNSQEGKEKGKDDSTTKSQDKKITDAEVESLGLGLKTVSELKDLLRKQLENQKENLAKNKQVQKAIDEAITKAKIKTPQTLIDQEVAKKEHDYKHRIQDLGLELEDFLKSQKTTIEEMKKNWQEESEKQIQTDLLLFEIAKKNELKVTNEEINAEINAITDEKLKEQYNSLDGRNYVSSIILQQKAINWLMKETGIEKAPSKK